MNSSTSQKQCTVHQKPYTHICLDQDCSQNFLLCETCLTSSSHKHSKTTIEIISEVRQKLDSAYELKDNKVSPYFSKIRQFYNKLRKQLNQMINEDEQIVETLLQKLSYHHLPVQANSLSYLEFKKKQYERLDKMSIIKLINQSQYGDLNRNLNEQKEILKMLDVEMEKLKEKVMTVKYVMLSKKIQVQLLCPKMTENSKVCQYEEMTKIYGLFNSKDLLIRHAKLVYRTSSNQFSSKNFFNACNNLPNCMALVKLQNGKKVGGFSIMPLVNPSQQEIQDQNEIIFENDRSKRSFIFSITQLASFEVKDNEKAIGYRKNSIGPLFGQDLDLSNKFATSNLGHSYHTPQGISVDSLQAKVVFLGAAKIQIKQLQIWQLCF